MYCSRYEVYSEQYILAIKVEAKLVIDMATTAISPAAMRYLGELSSSLHAASTAGLQLERSTLDAVAKYVERLMAAVKTLSTALTLAPTERDQTIWSHQITSRPSR